VLADDSATTGRPADRAPVEIADTAALEAWIATLP
jgi:hypothetical protein